MIIGSQFKNRHPKEAAMTFYCGIDLHSKKSHVCVIDRKENLNNNLTLILEFLNPFGKDVHIAIESTINWYWIVDGLQEARYDVRLAHTLGLHILRSGPVQLNTNDTNGIEHFGCITDNLFASCNRNSLFFFLPPAELNALESALLEYPSYTGQPTGSVKQSTLSFPFSIQSSAYTSALIDLFSMSPTPW
jgi:hypothetical protein